MRLRLDAHSPIPIRWQLTEQLKHVIEGGGVPRDQALPSIRELAGFLGINPNTVARSIEDLKRSGHVEARRGKGVFMASARSTRPFPTRREAFLKDAVIRAAVLEMTPDDVALGVLSVAGVGLAALRGAVAVLLVECSPPELDFFGRELEAHLPVGVDKVLLSELAGVVRRRKRADRWGAAVTSFGHLPEVERRLDGLGVPVVALLAEVIWKPSTAWPSYRRGRGSAWSPPSARPPITWSTRSSTRPCRTSCGSRPARLRARRWVGWCGGWTRSSVPARWPRGSKGSWGPRCQ